MDLFIAKFDGLYYIPKLCNHCLILEHFHHPTKTLYHQIPPFPNTLATTDLLFVSMDLSILDI